MSLKSWYKKKKMLPGAVDLKVSLPGEPLIYSIKYAVGSRTFGVNVFRDRQFHSILRCYLNQQMNSAVPVVVIVTYYVSPPPWIDIEPEVLRKEITPAVHSYEICDYILSFLEMLRKTLFNTYKQVVHLQATKVYSDEPRTVFQFMRWCDYVELQNKNPLQPKSKSINQKQQVVTL